MAWWCTKSSASNCTRGIISVTLLNCLLHRRTWNKSEVKYDTIKIAQGDGQF